ncbi:MAG: aldo/keto reductase [Sulfurimonadaceae bacterium]|nr:aldo/keto reductase [Sulfurimonadaceae bacterium]
MAQVALGTYRMTDLDPNHIAAIRMAVEAGVTLIDTSTNYMDGGAERAIAKAFQTISDEKAAKVEIVSKFGYVQGSTMQRLTEEVTYNNVVKYADYVWHCIDIDFMKDQLAHTLARLNRDTIDCYLIHNPEYFLLDAIKRGVPKEERLDEMLQRIYDAFIGLEEEVKAGRVKSYGISSNSFSKPQKSDEFLPYEDLVTLAQKAAKYAGNEKHAFTTLQMPMNLLEQEGMPCAKWAKSKGLRVLVNRPLNAQSGSKMYRLADYDEPRDYYHHLNAVLELFEDVEPLQPLYNLITELDNNKHRFGWIGDYEQFFHTQIVSHLRQAFASLDDEARPSVAESLDQFFEQYAKMVRYECSKKTREELESNLQGCEKPMQECAMEFLTANSDVDYVLTGMRKPAYIAEFTGAT